MEWDALEWEGRQTIGRQALVEGLTETPLELSTIPDKAFHSLPAHSVLQLSFHSLGL